MDSQQLEFDLRRSLEVATAFPDEKEVLTIVWQTFDQWVEIIASQSASVQLELAGEILQQIAELICLRSDVLIEDWKQQHDPVEPIVDISGRVDLVMQTQEFNLSGLVERDLPAPYPEYRQPPIKIEPVESAAGSVNTAQFVKVMGEDLQQGAKLTDEEAVEAFKAAIETAHDEDVAQWTEAIVTFWETAQVHAIPFVELCQQLNQPWIEVWLALLLGGFLLELRGDWYDGEIWIVGHTQR
ncbi:hypothetical protein [Leptolyngbya sp. GGD]|uniref:hypothetical protein n=1 Tax=Leptolyngbya sp. GGD TaxID=2997907 RepID=UPI00227B16ED|nr:hypothetical protein [Leptolyngbya sp. GGD]MCY6493894.1 hypothetical protein [Leptolyngbya sp. GGD]